MTAPLTALTTAPLATATVDDVFEALARVMGRYEARTEQLRMSRDMYEALAAGKQIMAHGPCGVGKSKAVLVAAGLLARQKDKRVLYCTGLKNLQDQLARDDLPDVALAFRQMEFPQDSLAQAYAWRDLGRDDARRWLPFCVLKGARNYACEREVERLRETLAGRTARRLPPDVSEGEARYLLDWAERYYDVSDLPSDAVVSLEAWDMVALGSGQCRGKKCKRERAECRYLGARARARNSRVTVVNYASLFTSIAMSRLFGMSSILDGFDYIVCDEAHRVEDEARTGLGIDLAPRQFFRTASKLGTSHAALRDALGQAVTDLFDVATSWSMVGDSGYGRTWTRRAHGPVRPSLDTSALEQHVASAILALTEEMEVTDDEERQFDLSRARATLGQLRDCVVEFANLDDPDRVYYVAGERERASRLVAELLEPAAALREHVWDAVDGAVLMSATLATGESDPFQRVRDTLGLDPDVRGEVYRSPFDWARDSLLLVPDPCPDKADDADTARSVLEAVRRSGGGALVLTTRWSAVDVVADYLEEHLAGIAVHRQRPGTSRVAAVQAFRDDPDSCLVGTSSMWTGVDVPGDSLRLVVVAKLPFPSPGSPYIAGMEARVAERKDEAHASGDSRAVRELKKWRSFPELCVPRCVRDLQQGVGRALRSATDRCAVVVLDDSIVTKSYGTTLMRALPEGLRVVRDWNALSAFYGHGGKGTA